MNKDATTDTLQKEEEGVMTVKFKDALSAEVCVSKMNGRYFDKRRVSLFWQTLF